MSLVARKSINCVQHNKKKLLIPLELRCDLILLIEVSRHLEPYSKFICMSVKKSNVPT